MGEGTRLFLEIFVLDAGAGAGEGEGTPWGGRSEPGDFVRWAWRRKEGFEEAGHRESGFGTGVGGGAQGGLL